MNKNQVKEIMESEEFKRYPELFTSEVLAHSTPERIQSIIHSEEFKQYPELFTSTVLAHSTPERIQSIIHSEEFKQYPELFTSQVLAHSTPERIQSVINMDEWKNPDYAHLLTSSILSRKKDSLRTNIKLAEKYNFSECISTQYLLKSPSQNYAIIRYCLDNGYDLIDHDGKLYYMFSYQPGVILKKSGIKLNDLIEQYPLDKKEDINEVSRVR